MLDATMKQQLAEYLTRVQHTIELRLNGDGSQKAGEMESLLGDIAQASDKVRVLQEVSPGAEDRQPSFSLAREGESPRVHFAGVPLGHEFSSLVLALLHVGGHPPRLEDGQRERIAGLSGALRFETYISLSCQNCPDVVQALNTLAALNPAVTHTMIDGALFPAEVEAKKIMAVPAVYLNGEPFAQGRLTLAEVLDKLDTAGAEAAAAAENRRLAEAAPFDVLVVGGGPAGASAAIYAARKGIRTGLLAERLGGQVMDTMGIENLISVPHTEGPALARALAGHVKEYPVDVMPGQRAVALIAGEAMHQIRLDSGATLRARSVVLAPGARWRELGVPGEDEYRGKGVCFCPHCDGPLFKGKRVAVIGGGNSGVEAAIDLAGIVAHVTLLEFGEALRADAVLQKKLQSLSNVDVLTSAQTIAVKGNGEAVTGIAYRDRVAGTEHELRLDGVFVQIGLLPNTDWLKGAVALSDRGEIEIDARCATSLSGVFAAGDATTTPYKQIVIALGEGAKASLSAFDHLIRH